MSTNQFDPTQYPDGWIPATTEHGAILIQDGRIVAVMGDLSVVGIDGQGLYRSSDPTPLIENWLPDDGE